MSCMCYENMYYASWIMSPQMVPELREAAKKLEEKVQAFDKLRDMEERVGDLEKELHWAMVYEIEAVRCCYIF